MEEFGRSGLVLVSLCCVKGVWSLGSVEVIMRVGEGGDVGGDSEVGLVNE